MAFKASLRPDNIFFFKKLFSQWPQKCSDQTLVAAILKDDPTPAALIVITDPFDKIL